MLKDIYNIPRTAMSIWALIFVLTVFSTADLHAEILPKNEMEQKELIERHVLEIFDQLSSIEKFDGTITYFVDGLTEDELIILQNVMANVSRITGLKIEQINLTLSPPPQIIFGFVGDVEATLKTPVIRSVFRNYYTSDAIAHESNEDYEDRISQQFANRDIPIIQSTLSSENSIITSTIIANKLVLETEEKYELISRLLFNVLVNANSNVVTPSLANTNNEILIVKNDMNVVWPPIDEALIRAIYTPSIRHFEIPKNVQEKIVRYVQKTLFP